MVSLFGETQSTAMPGSTVLVLDVEDTSVGGALVRLQKNTSPGLFAETRTALPVFATLESTKLREQIEKTATETLVHLSTVAARLRAQPGVSSVGTVSRAVVFFAAPWAHASARADGTLEWHWNPALTAYVTEHIQHFFGTIPVSFESTSAAAAHTAHGLFEQPDSMLVAFPKGEVTEMLHTHKGAGVGRATIPTGHNTLLRTLATHGNLTPKEVRSIVRLAHTKAPAVEPFADALSAAAGHIGGLFTETAGELLGTVTPSGILVIGDELAASWLGRTLSEYEPLIALFAEEAAVRTLGATHLTPFVDAHAAKPDLALLLQALFVGRAK